MTRSALAIFLILTAFTVSCGGRIPSDTKTAKLTKGYFHRYGKKFKETEFHQNKVTETEVKQTQELQKNVATSFVLVKLTTGTELPLILTLIRKFPRGWRITGWERVSQ